MSTLTYDSHDRMTAEYRLLYPVVSRRSGGLSLGINLNPAQNCVFKCVYCQVNRQEKLPKILVTRKQIQQELQQWLEQLQKNNFQYQGHQLVDIAIAGDGEPTLEPLLPEIISDILQLHYQYSLKLCKIVLFSNAYQINNPQLLKIMPVFFQTGGEVWLKLDCWDTQSLQQINRPAASFSFERYIQQLQNFAMRFPVILQSCFFQWDQQSFHEDLYQNYVALVKSFLLQNCQVKKIQIYTLARPPAEKKASPWPDLQMDQITSFIKKQLPIPIETIYSKGKNVT